MSVQSRAWKPLDSVNPLEELPKNTRITRIQVYGIEISPAELMKWVLYHLTFQTNGFITALSIKNLNIYE